MPVKFTIGTTGFEAMVTSCALARDSPSEDGPNSEMARNHSRSYVGMRITREIIRRPIMLKTNICLCETRGRGM